MNNANFTCQLGPVVFPCKKKLYHFFTNSVDDVLSEAPTNPNKAYPDWCSVN